MNEEVNKALIETGNYPGAPNTVKVEMGWMRVFIPWSQQLYIQLPCSNKWEALKVTENMYTVFCKTQHKI